jgi:hypothetical protein
LVEPPLLRSSAPVPPAVLPLISLLVGSGGCAAHAWPATIKLEKAKHRLSGTVR